MHALFSHLPGLLKMSAQASILIVLVLAAQWLCGRRLQPRWRCALWLLVLLRLALPWTIPSSASLFNVLKLPAIAPHAQPETVPVPAIDVPVTDAPISHAEGVAIAVSSPGGHWLAWLWAAGALCLAGCAAVNHYKIHRRVTRRRPLTDGPTLNLLEDCKALMGVRTPVTLLETEAIESPALFGFVRPRLLLPAGLASSFSREELRHVFLHELAHIKRHDVLAGWVMLGLQTVHWFNPLVWLAFHRLRADRELACDALALSCAQAGENEAYGLTIIKLLESFGQSVWAPGLAGILENKQQMIERIRMIAKFHKTNRGLALAVSLFAGLALVTLTDAQNGGSAGVSPKAETAQAKFRDRFEKKMAQDRAKYTPEQLRDAEQLYQVANQKSGSPEASESLQTMLKKYPDINRTGCATLYLAQSSEGDERAKYLQDCIEKFNDCFYGDGVQVGAYARFLLAGDYRSKGEENKAAALDNEIKTKYADAIDHRGNLLVNSRWDLQQKLQMAEAGNKWAAYDLWDAYYRGNHGIQPDPAQADKWLREFVRGGSVVRFEPVDDFAPTNPRQFLERVNHYASTFSGKTDLGLGSFFRTTKQDGKLAGSFLTSNPDELTARLAKVPGVKVTSSEPLTPENFIKYEQSPQESLTDQTKFRDRFEKKMAQDRAKYAPEQLRDAEQLYQVANQKWGSPEANESLQTMLKKYPDINRTGCATLYLAQSSEGDERAKYLHDCIEKFNDCFYGDGVQVGAYARFLLAEDYRSKGEENKAAALDNEIKTKYADAIDHRGNLLVKKHE